MTISITKYVDITSSVGAGSAVPEVELIGRLYTTNPLLPTNSYLEFTSAAQVGAYFGTSSEEYARAVQYFTFVGKTGLQPKKISFARWADTDTYPQIYGAPVSTTLSTYTTIANGSLTMTIGGVTNVLTGLDFTSAVSLSGVAAVIETAINAETGLQWTAATVSWNAVRQAFNFVGGDNSVAADISVSPTGSGTDLQNIIGWNDLAIFSNGIQTQTITDVLTDSAAQSDNFGSFVFMPTLSLDEHVEAATWNAAQNVKFQYYIPTLLADYSSWSTALEDIGMCACIISETAGEYPEQGPMQTMAATNYNGVNAVQNYMYQQYNLTPSVTDDTTSNALDAAKVNYNGLTQSVGTQISFFQRGFLFGPDNSPGYMNIGANEQWFRGANTAALMSLLLVLGRIPANAQGISEILATLQTVINRAVLNGTISVEKELTATQKAFITGLTGDSTAWVQVQSIGYWVTVTMDAVNGIANYLIIYSKDDVVRQINGQQVLI